MTEAQAGNIKGEKDKARKQRVKENYAVVGELVLMSTGLDFLLNRVLMAVLDLGTSHMIEPVVATLDPTRKLEILKERAAHIANADWKKGVTKFCDKVESVFRQRNIACHTPPIFDDGGSLTFKAVAAAKLFKTLDLSTKTARAFPLNDFRTAIKTGEAALGAGLNLIENFDRFNAEVKRRAAAKEPPPRMA
jgi:hypothetical protein